MLLSAFSDGWNETPRVACGRCCTAGRRWPPVSWSVRCGVGGVGSPTCCSQQLTPHSHPGAPGSDSSIPHRRGRARQKQVMQPPRGHRGRWYPATRPDLTPEIRTSLPEMRRW